MGEAEDGVVGTVFGDVVEEPGSGVLKGGRGVVGPEGVVGGFVEEVDS